MTATTSSTAQAQDRQLERSVRELVKRNEEKRGFLIAFEGPDGSGKTTQRKLFKEWLTGEGHSVVTTKWNSSKPMKPLVKARKTARSLGPEEFCLLHAADFRYRLETEILPQLWQGKMVIADRYLFTALARDAARGLDLDWLLHIYSPLFWPDMVFYFSISPETSGKRIAVDRTPKYYEAGQDITGIDDPHQSYQKFISCVIQEYDALARIFQFITIDAERSIYDQHRQIRKLFEAGPRRPWVDWNLPPLLDWFANQNEDEQVPVG